MVFIHGGGFFAGSGSPDSYGPDYLIEHDIVLVTTNYRLHALGKWQTNIRRCTFIQNHRCSDKLLSKKDAWGVRTPSTDSVWYWEIPDPKKTEKSSNPAPLPPKREKTEVAEVTREKYEENESKIG